MTQRYVLSPRAQSDLDEIWHYTESRWGIGQAETYIRQLARDIKAIAAKPTLARACPEVRHEYYKFKSGSHLIFLRRNKDDIEIIRILHERMDFEQHL